MNTTGKKRQLANDENADPNQEAAFERGEENKLNGVLPLTRVKRLIKMSAMSNTNVSAGAAKLIQLCAEEYLRAFVRTAKTYTEQAGRKTIQPKDLTRVIKDDWAFALLEDALADWPNDIQQAQLPTIVPQNDTDSSTLFFRQPDTLPEPTDTQLTDREPPQLDDEYTDARSETATELNETTDIFTAPDSLEVFASSDPTPKPTMEYLHIQNPGQCRLASPLTFRDDSPNNDLPSDDEVHYQKLLLDQEEADEEERPHNSRFMSSRKIDDEVEEEGESSFSSPVRSPRDFDIDDMEDGFF